MSAAWRVFVPGDAAALSVGAEPKVAGASREARRAAELPIDARAQRQPGPVLARAAGRDRDAARAGSASARSRPTSRRPVRRRARSTRARHAAGHPLAARPGRGDCRTSKDQQRLTFARCGITDPLSLDDYEAHGGWRGLRRALAMAPAAIVEEVVDLGPARPRRRRRSRPASSGGPSPRRAADQKYIVCNADEGDCGTFADRMLMEGDPFVLIEGMAIAGLAVGATKGYVYIRSEYPHAYRDAWRAAIAIARAHGLLGHDMLGQRAGVRHRSPPRRRRLHLRRGDRAAGEPRGQARQVRVKPPLPAIEGLFGKPTVINNVISLATVPVILDEGARGLRATSAWAARAARCRSSSPATSSTAGWSRRPSA